MVLLPLLHERAWGVLHWFFCHYFIRGLGRFSAGGWGWGGGFSIGFFRHCFELDLLALTARGLWGRGGDRGGWEDRRAVRTALVSYWVCVRVLEI